MSDENSGESGFMPVNQVNVDAVRSEGYEKGYTDGLRDGEAVGFGNGYAKGMRDLIERLRGVEPFTREEHAHCLYVMSEMAGGVTSEAFASLLKE